MEIGINIDDKCEIYRVKQELSRQLNSVIHVSQFVFSYTCFLLAMT